MTDNDLQQLLSLDAFPGPALVLEPMDADAIIENALTGAGFGPAGGGGPGPSTPAPAVRGGIATGTKLAIGALALAVAVVIAILALRRSHGHAVAPIDAAIDAPPDVSSGSGAIDASIAPTIDADAAGGADDDEADIELDPEPAHPHKPRLVETRAPDDLLGEANAKRAAKQWRESDLLYMRVVRRAPKSLAAQTALVASASLRLEHLGDPRGATKRFRRALAIAPNGALAEEARWGLAEAARAQHDDAAEAHALDDFLTHHGSSPLAARARARRSELP